jgi:hypothetical protein
MALRYKKTADRPALKLWLLDDDLTLIDLTSYAHVLKVGHIGSAAGLTKNSNIAGAAGAGAEPTGTPNCVVTWTAGELAVLTPGLYDFELTSTLSGLDRVFTDTLEILDVIT